MFDRYVAPEYDSSGNIKNVQSTRDAKGFDPGFAVQDARIDLELNNAGSGPIRIIDIHIVPIKVDVDPANGMLVYTQQQGGGQPEPRLVSLIDSTDSRFYMVDPDKPLQGNPEPYFDSNSIVVDGGKSEYLELQVVPTKHATTFSIEIVYTFNGERRTLNASNGSKAGFRVSALRCPSGKIDYESAAQVTVADMHLESPETVRRAAGLEC